MKCEIDENLLEQVVEWRGREESPRKRRERRRTLFLYVSEKRWLSF